ncbi:hypothetical protein PVIIG_05785 [Plasmodium vivax India VII]|uniref:PIR Superfamily Protein n=1 Tax=Plasmodium vivax India VII TaxID=1077284 RepID=A0A0J9UT54_PLAVI|nr:hypothetical protein PVIIG_05785 [Plasmodium vivax India VII]
MCSTQAPDKESYEFFENIEKYIENAKSAESTPTSSKAQSECNSFVQFFGSDFKNTTRAKIICEHFIKLYDSLTELKSNSNSDTNYNKSSQFLNYWINSKLSESMLNEDDSVCDVYNSLESRITDSDGHHIFLNFIYNINKVDLKKMNILYSLYEKYTDLYTILKNNSKVDTESTFRYSNKCFNDYYNAISMCNGEKNKFFEELEKYKEKYETLYELLEKRRGDYYTSFVRLTNGKNNNMVTTSVIGTTVGLIPLFGFLYKVREIIIKL